LLDGAAGVRQFQDHRVHHPRVTELRLRVEAMADASLGTEEARVTINLQDGRCVERQVRCAPGGLERPMSDADLSAKFRDLATEVLATDQAERMLALAWNIRALGDVGALIRASVPDDELEPAELPGSPLIPR
jgi:2-methylcitrate dehydratase PrpD